MQMSTAHHLQIDGQIEQLSRVVEETLRHYGNVRQDDWENLLPCSPASGMTAYRIHPVIMANYPTLPNGH